MIWVTPLIRNSRNSGTTSIYYLQCNRHLYFLSHLVFNSPVKFGILSFLLTRGPWFGWKDFLSSNSWEVVRTSVYLSTIRGPSGRFAVANRSRWRLRQAFLALAILSQFGISSLISSLTLFVASSSTTHQCQSFHSYSHVSWYSTRVFSLRLSPLLVLPSCPVSPHHSFKDPFSMFPSPCFLSTLFLPLTQERLWRAITELFTCISIP